MTSSAIETDSSSGRESVTTGSGNHGPGYVSRRMRAERSSSIASRVVTVATNAFGFSTASVRCMRSNASCTTSSASATLPSMR